MKNSTHCTLCNREVSVVRNWSRWQSGQSPEWRVVRHRATERRAPSHHREKLCLGGGILVGESDVQAHQAVSA